MIETVDTQPAHTVKRSKSPLRSRIRLILVVGLAVLLFASFQQQAIAHARLETSDPAAGIALPAMPDAFVLTFTEAFDLGLSDFRLTNVDGNELPISDPVVSQDNSSVLTLLFEGEDPEPGVYTIIWRVLSSVDGHVTSGSVPFSVGTGESPAVAASDSARPPWWQIVPRWLELSGWGLLAGLAGFGLINFSGIQHAERGLRRTLLDRWRSIWFFAFSLALTGMVSGIIAQTLKVSGASSLSVPESAALGDVLAETDYGQGWLIRLTLAIGLLVIIGLATRLHRRSHWAALLAISIGAIATISATGHAAGEPRKWLAVLVDTIHMTGAGIWIGGLVVLVLVIVVRPLAAPAGEASVTSRLVRNHSRTSLLVMATIIFTGVISASFHVGGFRSLRTEDYGIALLIKVALLLVVIVAAAINLLVLIPRVKAFEGAGDVPSAQREVKSAGYVAAFETGIATLILLATAILTVLAPADYPLPVDVAGRAMVVDETLTADDLSVRLRATARGNPGEIYEISVADESGAVPADIQRIIVETALQSGPNAGLGDRFDADPVEGEPGRFEFAATRLGLEGPWELNVIVRRAGLQDVETAFLIDTTGSAPGQPRLVDDTWRLPEMTLAAWGFLALAIVMIIIGLAGLRRLTGMEPVASGVLLAMCVLIAAGFAISASRQTIPVTSGQHLVNPVEPGDVSLRSGESLFTANCMVCHGVDGRGLSTEGMSHSADAADLGDRAAREQTDGDLFTRIGEGIPATDMPAFDEALSDDERWELVNYIRQLQETDD